MSENTTNTAGTDVETPEVPEVETPEVEENDEDREFSNLTPYAAAEIANRVLGVKEGDKPRTSQTFYSYARNGSIASNYKQWDADGAKKSGYKVELDGKAFMQWLNDSAAGKIKGRSRSDYDKLAAEFALSAE
jgi:hypothetical protein